MAERVNLLFAPHEAGVWALVLANRPRVIMRSDDKADRRPGARQRVQSAADDY